MSSADQRVALGLGDLLEHGGLADRAQLLEQTPGLVVAALGERVLDAPDQLRRHLVQRIALDRSSARLGQALRLDDATAPSC